MAEAKDDTRLADETIERIRELNERAIEATRQAGTAYLQAYEQALKSIVEYQERLAGVSGVDWVQRLVEAQANFTREVGNLYASSLRQILK